MSLRLGVTGALIALCGCAPNKILPPPVAAYDYRDRHPVVLAEAGYTLDVFPSADAGLDSATALRIRDFVTRYRRFGHGKIAVLAPAGAPKTRAMAEVRHALAEAGVGGLVVAGTYPVTDTHLAAPIRLTFEGIKAKVANRCGDWPEDLASGGSLAGWQNKSYWNFGCANQSTLAAQVADPRDLANPRGETPADIEMRMRAIESVREGEDPTTKWETKPANISNIGAGGS